MNTAILINYAANNHTGKKKWLRIKEKVLQLLPYEPILLPYETPFIIKDCVKKLNKDKGVEFFISAGGDGSVNYLLNALMEVSEKDLKLYVLGAIGMGSSNDFLKPFTNQIDGIPVKIDPNKKILADIGKVSYEDIKGIKKSRFFIINASLGITADANLLFNQDDPFIRIMKSRFVNLTILYTAIKTLLNYENKRMRISNGSNIKDLKIANISLTKNLYISGSIHIMASGVCHPFQTRMADFRYPVLFGL